MSIFNNRYIHEIHIYFFKVIANRKYWEIDWFKLNCIECRGNNIIKYIKILLSLNLPDSDKYDLYCNGVILNKKQESIGDAIRYN